jgi:hypothetical protein
VDEAAGYRNGDLQHADSLSIQPLAAASPVAIDLDSVPRKVHEQFMRMAITQAHHNPRLPVRRRYRPCRRCPADGVRRE